MQTGAGRCHRPRLPIVQFAATASMALPAGRVACDRLHRPLTRRPLPTELGACKGDGQNQVLSSVLKAPASARRGVAPTPLARRPCEETSPIALPAPAALSALVAIRHLDLAPVVRSNQATPVFSHDRASPRCCGAVQDRGVKPGCRTCADSMELPARGSRRPDPRPHAARGSSPLAPPSPAPSKGEAQPGIFQAPGGHQGGVRFFSTWSPWLLQLVDVCLHHRHQMTSTTWNGTGRQRRGWAASSLWG